MTDFSPVRQQDAILADLGRLVAQRAQGVQQAESARKTGLEAAQVKLDQEKKQAQAEAQAAAQANQAEFERRKRELEARFEADYRPAEQKYAALKQRILARFNAEKAAAKKINQEARWETTTVFDATKHKPRREFLEAERQVKLRAERFEAVATEAKHYLEECRLYREPNLDTETPPPVDDNPLQRFLDKLTATEAQLVDLKASRLPRLVRGGAGFWITVGLVALLVGPAGYLSNWQPWPMGIAGAVGLLLGGGVAGWIYFQARSTALRVYDALCQTILDGETARQQWLEQATEKCQREQNEIKQKYEGALQRAADIYNAAKDAAKLQRSLESQSIEETYPAKMAEVQAQFNAATTQATAEHAAKNADIVKARNERLRAAQQAFEHGQAECESRYQSDWQTVGDQWRAGLRSVYAAAQQLNLKLDERYPDWNAADWETWTPPTNVAPAIRIGQFNVGLEQIPGGLSEDSRLAADVPPSFQLPAMLSFPNRGSMVLKVAGSAARSQGIDVLQSVMLRYLMAIPPGKVRFTIIDPVGLGQNFAGFMHLSDYDELLVSHKIWTEPQQIEQRLSDLTAHMANVIQKYLRNEFETIEDYNLHAGEVAEPFRILVVANFPFNFTEAAMRYLLSIASTGSRCGVYTLVSVDTRLSIPSGFKVGDLEQHGIKLVWREDKFVWREERFEPFALQLETPPTPDRFSKIVHIAGEGAKNASRVEVPFDFIAPPREDQWISSGAQGVDVPLGRAGATKRQNLKLGRGTSQHVLIAGKTGSGKSTLMHALITNLALMYSPDEVELYLIDFKKGVEFKTYAQFQLPHARVIAIESEREFGLSVLQRLDVELKVRGDKFRDANVQDLNGYRQTAGSERMPRILFIVDEFQEFFVEDDKIAQDVSLLLDRMVRQGRAFGIHVILGSQTLGGAYGLARSTLGQMAIRIALQCSEADANLILSEENSAARLLTRPGEAIYNDANGRLEGNHLFQVVWLSDDRHEDYLRQVQDLAQRHGLQTPAQIVFEGNIPADITKNLQLHELIAAPAWPPTALAPLAWLGDAIAIKDPTAAAFRRQSGANLIMLGQQSEASLAMIMVALVSLAAQQPVASADTTGGAKFYLLDGSPPDAMHVGTLAKLAGVLPHAVEIGGPRDVPRIIGELAAELERRQASSESDPPALYLVVYDLPRFRELRKAEDDFGFSRGEEKPNPAKQFPTLLREGPGFGIHVITWCDTLNNLYRSCERQVLREFENRVIFQVSVADSSSLIDSPMASRLGPNRAFLHSEEQGRLEKFRPYSLPTEQWLAWVGEQLRRKVVEPARAGES